MERIRPSTSVIVVTERRMFFVRNRHARTTSIHRHAGVQDNGFPDRPKGRIIIGSTHDGLGVVGEIRLFRCQIV